MCFRRFATQNCATSKRASEGLNRKEVPRLRFGLPLWNGLGLVSEFVVRRSSFVVRRSSFVVRRSLFVVGRWTFDVRIPGPLRGEAGPVRNFELAQCLANQLVQVCCWVIERRGRCSHRFRQAEPAHRAVESVSHRGEVTHRNCCLACTSGGLLCDF
ncbi:MAG: hypothetical protein ACI8P0_000483 [Planctomycetaceae bacterium]|jgi:hypothetical protein